MKAFPVTVLCAVMKVSRSGFYDYLHSRSPHGGNSPGEAMLVAKIKEIFIEHKGGYGSRRIVREMKNQGYPIGRFKVRRIMRQLNLRLKFDSVFLNSMSFRSTTGHKNALGTTL